MIPEATPEDLALDLAAVLARAEAATPGPWFDAYNCVHSKPLNDEYQRLEAAIPDDTPDEEWPDLPQTFVARVETAGGDTPTPRGSSDAAFIAAARSDVPALCRLVAHWQREAERLRVAAAWETARTAPALCTWQGPEGQTCTDRWQTDRTGHCLCNRHASLVELAKEPLRPAE